jgi:hypothetical protein
MLGRGINACYEHKLPSSKTKGKRRRLFGYLMASYFVVDNIISLVGGVVSTNVTFSVNAEVLPGR